jgi:hypothetical protein
MATVKSVIVTAIDAANPQIADKVDYMGEVRYIPVEYSTDISGGNTLLVSKPMPPSTKLIGLQLAFTALAGSATADVGYVGTATSDIILDGIDVSSAALVTYPAAAPGTNGGDGGAIDVSGKVLSITLAGETLSTDSIGGYILVVST